MSDALKNIERGTKALAIRMLARVSPKPDAASGSLPADPDWGAGPRRVLYLRYDRIGDMVLATGIIKAITAAQPSVTVDVLASPANARVLLGNPHVGRVLTFDRKRRRGYLAALVAMRRGRYDAVIDAMVMAPSLTTMLLMWASGARMRIGVGDRGNAYALTLPVPRLADASHYIDHSAALLAAFGVDPEAAHRAHQVDASQAPSSAAEAPDAGMPSSGWDIWRPEIFLTDAEREAAESQWGRGAARRGAAHREKVAEQKVESRGAGTVGATASSPSTAATATASPTATPTPVRGRRFVVNVSAGAPHRYWAESKFIQVIGRIAERFPGTETMVIGAPEDGERMDRIASASGASLARTPDYRQMMALVAASDLVLTADTSVTHIASAFGTPAIVMCARGLAPLYGPYGTTGRTVSTPGRTLESLEVEPVARALEAVAAASAAATPAAATAVTVAATVAANAAPAPGDRRSH